MSRQLKPESYETLIYFRNKERKTSERTECECGKMVFVSQLDKHLNTTMHSTLLKRKTLYEIWKNTERERKIKRLQELREEIKKLLAEGIE
jgi:hypothetical protein